METKPQIPMGAEIIALPGATPTSVIAQYLRIGDSGHHQLAELLAEGRFPAKRVVIDASQYKFQRDLVAALKRAGAEIVLDTKAAELAEPGKYLGNARNAPWAAISDGKILSHDFFKRNSDDDVIAQMARFAVEHGFNAVLAPTHFLRNGPSDSWLEIDRLSCERLRAALDKAGGGDIAVDYSLLIQHTALRDAAQRGALVSSLKRTPFDNLWIRASGFGADGTPAGAREYINALCAMHEVGKPVIADHLGGLIGAAAAAFGATSGQAHGVGEKARFDAGEWDKPPPKRDKDDAMGRPKRFQIPAIDTSLTVHELNALAKARGGHRLVVCLDRTCCPHGLENMINDSKAHALKQSFAMIARLEAIPDARRAEHFIKTDLALADQQARQIKELRPVVRELVPRPGETAEEAAEKLVERLKKHARRNEKLRAVLENLQELRGSTTSRARPAVLRVHVGNRIHGQRQ